MTDPGSLLTESGVPWSEYGSYLESLNQAGYGAATTQPERETIAAEILPVFKQELVAKQEAAMTIYSEPVGLGGQPTEINQAGLPIGALVGLLLKYAPWVAGAIGGLTSAGAVGLLGGGNGNGTSVIPGTDIVLQGPGAPEPYPKMIAKEWAGIGGSRFYLLINGRVVVRKRNGVYRLIKRPAMIHMLANNPRLGDVVKADRVIQRAVKVVRRRLPSARRK